MARRVSLYNHASYYRWYNTKTNIENVELYREIKKIIYKRYKNPLIFDIGCGQGFLTSYVRGIGFDINKYVINMAKKNYLGTKFYRSDANAIDINKLKSKKADVIICLNLIEHMPDIERIKFLNSTIPNLLKKNGLLIFSLYRQYNFLNMLNMLFQRKTIFDPTHIHNWTPNQFKSELSKYFKILKHKNLAGYTKLTFITKYIKSETLVIAKLK